MYYCIFCLNFLQKSHYSVINHRIFQDNLPGFKVCFFVAYLWFLLHFVVDYLTYQSSSIPCLFSVCFLLFLPSVSRDYFSTPLNVTGMTSCKFQGLGYKSPCSLFLCPFGCCLENIQESHFIIREKTRSLVEKKGTLA